MLCLDMRLPRFTILQMLLAAALVALVLGLVTSAWRTKRLAQIMHLEFSPSGKYLAAKYSGGSIQVWDVSGARPRLTQHVPAQGLFSVDIGQIQFADDDTLIDLQNEWADTGFATTIRSIDLKSGRIIPGQPIPYSAYAPSFSAAGKVLALPNAGTGAFELYDLPSVKLRRVIQATGNPWFVELSEDGRHLAAIDQNGSLSLFDVAADKTLLTRQGSTMLYAMDFSGGQFAAASLSTTGGPQGDVEVMDLPGTAPPRTIKTGLAYVTWLRLTADGKRLAVADYMSAEYYDVASGKLLKRLVFFGPGGEEISPFSLMFSGGLPGQNLALAPDGNTLASFNGGQITFRDLPSGNVRQRITGGWRSLQIVIFTVGFVIWSAAWGIVARRERLRQIEVAPVPAHPIERLHADRPVNPPPKPLTQLLPAAGWILVAVVLAAILLSLEWSWSIPEIIGYTILMVVAIVVAVVVLAVAYSWVMRLVMGPNYLTLVRLKQIAHDPGRQHTSGLLTAAFFGPSNIETQHEVRVATVLQRASELFGAPIQFTRKSLIACLDRQGDLDAFMLRHVPIAAVVPNVWTARLAVVCEETALRNLVDPPDAFAAALALLLTIQQKRGFLPGWVGTLCIHSIAKSSAHAAGLRAATRRQRVLAIRRPDWDPRQVFTRTANERAAQWLAADQPDAWREVHAELDFLATLGEVLLGQSATPERSGRVLEWLRSLRPKDNPLETLSRDVGVSVDELVTEWRAWLDSHTGLPFDPLPEAKAAAAGALHSPILWDRSRPSAERGRAVRQLGGSGFVALSSLLLDELDEPRCDIRFDVIEALENLSGQTLGDDPAAWNAWYEGLPPDVRAWPAVAYTRAAADAPLEAVVLNDSAPPSAPAATPATAAPAIPRASRPRLDQPPTELKLCWGLMFLGGCAALTIPIALMFLWGPLFFPTIYFGLFAGARAVSSGAARETLGLKGVASLQAANLIACDPINLLLGSMEFNLLSRPRVLEFLLQVNGGRL